MSTSSQHCPDDAEARLPTIIAGYLADLEGSADVLCTVLRRPVAGAVAAFLGPEGPESDDVVQESLLAVLAYVRERGGFEGNLVRFAVTVARNRCRNILAWRRRRPHVEIEPLAEWIAAPEHNPLDAYGENQVTAALRASLADLDLACHELLQALFLRGQTPESLCSQLGLTTARAVYYRRENCLKSLQNIMIRRLGSMSP